MIDRYDLAFEDFDGALGHLRGNQAINYEQIGLKFILFSAEVLFNKCVSTMHFHTYHRAYVVVLIRGLALMRMGRFQEGMELLYAAQLEKSTPEHDVIDDAIAESGEGYTVFSIVRPKYTCRKRSKLKISCSLSDFCMNHLPSK